MTCETKVLEVLIITGKARGQRYFLPRIPMTSQANSLPFVLQRRQFPVKLAWAMSINKAQGQSLEKAGIYLEEPVFAHGQLYVALSRASGFKTVCVLVQDSDAQGKRLNDANIPDGTYTDNIVYRDILVTPMVVSSHSRARSEPQLSTEWSQTEDMEVELEVYNDAPDSEHDQLQSHPQVDHASDNVGAMLEASSALEPNAAHDGEGLAYTGHFEPQVLGRCGLHALNNALGFPLLNHIDMSHACNVYLAEMQMEGSPELRNMHENEHGWYSEAVMATALRVKGNLYKLDVDKPLQPVQDEMHEIYADDVIGIVATLDVGTIQFETRDHFILKMRPVPASFYVLE